MVMPGSIVRFTYVCVSSVCVCVFPYRCKGAVRDEARVYNINFFSLSLFHSGDPIFHAGAQRSDRRPVLLGKTNYPSR